MENRYIFLILIFLQTLLISGCSYDYYFKDEFIVAKQRKLFNQLCSAKERSIIYQTAKAEGYLSASNGFNSCLQGWDPIFEYGYRYAECTTAVQTSYVLPDNADIYRYTLEPEDHPDCGTGERHFVGYSRRAYHGNSPAYKDTNRGDNYKKKHKVQLSGKCLVVKKVDKPMSRYMVLHEHLYNDEGKDYHIDDIYKKYSGNYDKKKGIITKSRVSVIDMDTGQYLAQYNNYSFFPKNMIHGAGLGISEGCKGGRIYLSPKEVLFQNINNN